MNRIFFVFCIGTNSVFSSCKKEEDVPENTRAILPGNFNAEQSAGGVLIPS